MGGASTLHAAALKRVMHLTASESAAVLRPILFLEMGQLDLVALDALESLCTWERLTRRATLNAATSLWAGTAPALVVRAGANGTAGLPRSVTTSFVYKCARIAHDIGMPSPVQWRRTGPAHRAWRPMVHEAALRDQVLRTIGSDDSATDASGGRYANYLALLRHDPPSRHGPWATRYAAEVPHVFRMRLQLTGIPSQQHPRGSRGCHLLCSHPPCTNAGYLGTPEHTLCTCRLTARHRSKRDETLREIVQEALLLPGAPHTQAPFPPSNLGTYSAMLQGAPVHVFAGLPQKMRQHPKPDGAVQMEKKYLAFLKVSDSFIRHHVPQHSPWWWRE